MGRQLLFDPNPEDTLRVVTHVLKNLELWLKAAWSDTASNSNAIPPKLLPVMEKVCVLIEFFFFFSTTIIRALFVWLQLCYGLVQTILLYGLHVWELLLDSFVLTSLEFKSDLLAIFLENAKRRRFLLQLFSDSRNISIIQVLTRDCGRLWNRSSCPLSAREGEKKFLIYLFFFFFEKKMLE